MDYHVLLALLAPLLGGGIVLCLELGYRLGRRGAQKAHEAEKTGIGVIDAAVFGLLGLILALTIGGSVSRLDHRRQLILQETLAVGTAYQRLDILAPTDRTALQGLFKEYLGSRLQLYRLLPEDVAAAKAELAKSEALAGKIWSAAVTAAKAAAPQPAVMLLLPALNQMFDVATERTRYFYIHLPPAFIAILMVTAWACSVLAGYSLYNPRGRNFIHMAVFAVVITAAFSLIMDLDYPRLGLITLRDMDQGLLELWQSLR
ncbi:MAG: DUF4239 domain-containing protein [Deltaproteobacteria bacterium]|nr:DUF4239 domain-containing protein [Deltaproteobacteria bacterium]